MDFKIAVIKGDGIGPEIIDAALHVLEAVGREFTHRFKFDYLLAGGAALEKEGPSLPKKTVRGCKNCDAALIGAIGDPKWDNQPNDKHPGKVIPGLRKEFGLFANICPVVTWDQLVKISPLKSDIIARGLDILIVRELNGGIYSGPRGTEVITGKTSPSKTLDRIIGAKPLPEGRFAYDVEQYAEVDIRRIAKLAFDMAMKRNKHVTSVDMSNALDSSRLWRAVVEEIRTNYPEIRFDNMYLNDAVRQLIKDPGHFDVIVAGNMLGDILANEANQITGTVEMLPSASIGDGRFGLYGSLYCQTPEHAGENSADPIAAILSAAMMLRISLSLEDEAAAIEKAVGDFLTGGDRTPDIWQDGAKATGTSEIGKMIANLINKV